MHEQKNACKFLFSRFTCQIEYVIALHLKYREKKREILNDDAQIKHYSTFMKINSLSKCSP